MTIATTDGQPHQPVSLAEIALLRTERDPTTPFLLTIDEPPPHAVYTRSYGDVAATARALGAALRDAGVAPGERVGCYMSNAPCWVVASLATWWSGAAVAAVGTLLPAAEAAKLFALADVRTVIAVDDAPPLPSDFQVITVDSEGRVAGQHGPFDPMVPAADDLAAVFFTSGTTGLPKGITYAHKDCIASATRVAGTYSRTASYRPDPAPPHLAPGVVFNPFGHTAGLARLAFRMWIGRPTVLVRKFTVPSLQAYLSHFTADSLQLTPTMIHMVATSEVPLDLSGTKYVTSGTAPLSIATRDLFEQRFGIPVIQTYGSTEIGVVSQERLDDVLAGRRGPGSVGRLADGVEVRIRPIDDDRPAGEGEILARTRELPTEFVGGAKVPVDAEGWYATGDVGRFDADGILYITGRVQDKIIVGGFNVYPAEVEDLARQFPAVDDVIVVGVADDRLGERPVAGVVWSGAPDEAGLVEHLRAALASYKVPRGFFTLEAVPQTARGKIDRQRARVLADQALGTSSSQ
jgi:acyl-CoA synthetase (AMP-forming)/AMP-acid ligase II